jgi:hypothetical protein
MYGGPSNEVRVDPGLDYSATVRLDELYDLSLPGSYTLKVVATFDTLSADDSVLRREGVTSSDEVTFRIP